MYTFVPLIFGTLKNKLQEDERIMAYNQKLLSKFNLNSKMLEGGEESSEADMMSDPSYLRQSSALINDALQKGFDILQLANGDIVMTGVKTVVYQYSWDESKGKLVRSKFKSSKKRTTNAMPQVPSEEEEDA